MTYSYSRYLFLLAMAIFLGACQFFGGGNVEIDNYGDETLVVSIDDQTYTLGPGGYERVQLSAGIHLAKVEDVSGEVVQEGTFKIQEGGLLNIAGGEYYLWTDLYGDPALRGEKLKEEWIDIGDKQYFGEVYALPTDELYIEQRWDYGLDKDFPEDLLGWRFTPEKYLIKTKLFRREGFVEEYKSLSETR